MLVVTLGLVSCGGGNQSSSTGASVTAQATTATVSACNASSSFGGAGPALTETSNPTLEACNAAITFTCNASTTFGGIEPALTEATSPSIKTCLAVMNESNSNDSIGSKILVGKATIGGTCSYNGLTNVQVGLPCSLKGCLAGFPAPSNSPCWNALLNTTPSQCAERIIFMGGDLQFYSGMLPATGFCIASGSP